MSIFLFKSSVPVKDGSRKHLGDGLDLGVPLILGVFLCFYNRNEFIGGV